MGTMRPTSVESACSLAAGWSASWASSSARCGPTPLIMRTSVARVRDIALLYIILGDAACRCGCVELKKAPAALHVLFLTCCSQHELRLLPLKLVPLLASIAGYR